MLSALAFAYVTIGYWYFWQVLLLDVRANPGDLALCAVLGLLFGPLFMAGAVVIYVDEFGDSALKRNCPL